MRSALKHIVAIALFAVWCASATAWVVSYQYADEDTGSAVRQARACIEQGQCAVMGPPTSVPGLHHGASWTRLIAHYFRSGGGLVAVQLSVLVALMASGAVSFFLFRRYLSESAALLGLLLCLQPVMATARFSELSNATLLPLPLALYYASTAVCVEFGSWVAGAAASVFLAAAMSANLSCAVLVPFHIGLVALFARPPLKAVFTAGVALALTFALESSEVVVEITRDVFRTPIALGVLDTVAIVLGIGQIRRRFVALVGRSPGHVRRWRQHLGALPVPTRVRVALQAAGVYVSMAVWVGCALARTSIPEGHYLAALVLPLVFLAAASAERLSRRVVVTLGIVGLVQLLLLPFAPVLLQLWSVLILLLSLLTIVGYVREIRRGLGRAPVMAQPAIGVFLLSGLTLATSLPDTVLLPRQRLTWPIPVAERLIDNLYKSGYTFPQLMVALQRESPATTEFMVTTLDPNLFGQPEGVKATGWSLLALVVDSAVIARTEGVILNFPVGSSQSAIVVRAPSYLDRTRLRTCYSTVCGAGPDHAACIERVPGRPLRHAPPHFEVDRQEMRAPGTMFAYQPAGTKYCILFSMPLHTLGSHTPHIIRLLEQWPLRMHITDVSGVSFDGQLPGLEVRLNDDREATGTLEVEVSRDTFGPDADWMEDPPLIEVTAANEHLLEPFRHHLVARW